MPVPVLEMDWPISSTDLHLASFLFVVSTSSQGFLLCTTLSLSLQVLYPDPWDLPSLAWQHHWWYQAPHGSSQHGAWPVAAGQDQGVREEPWVGGFTHTHTHTHTHARTHTHKHLVTILYSVQLFLLEELRERKYDGFAHTIQKAWRRYKSDQYFYQLKKKGILP